MRVVVEISNTDPRLIKWLCSVFGGRATYKDMRTARRHVCFRWQVLSVTAHAVLLKCLPYFIIKRDQAETAIAFRETNLVHRGRAGNEVELNTTKESLYRKLRAQKTEHLLPLRTTEDLGTAHELIN